MYGPLPEQGQSPGRRAVHYVKGVAVPSGRPHARALSRAGKNRGGIDRVVRGRVRRDSHDAAGFHAPGFLPGKKKIMALLMTEFVPPHRRIHRREIRRGNPAAPHIFQRGAHGAVRAEPARHREDDALVPVFLQNRPGVDVIVQKAVVKGDERRSCGQGRAFKKKRFRFIQPDAAPARFGHAPAVRLESLRRHGYGSPVAGNVVVHKNWQTAAGAHRKAHFPTLLTTRIRRWFQERRTAPRR